VLLIDIEPHDTYRMIMANTAFYEMSGYAKDSIGNTVDSIIKPESYSKLTVRYKKVQETKKPLEYAEWYDTPSGKKLYEVRLIPIFNAVGECVQIAAVTHDGTQAFNVKEYQKEAAETLEQIAYNLRTL